MLKTTLCALLLSALPFTPKQSPAPPPGTAKIQVALLLDTSNSMDGLIDQAKSQLWKMVNRLADAQRQNQGIELEIALYEYGNDGLPSNEGYIRLVQPLGKDLDGLSEKLFELRTNGGSEYCGWVIKTSLVQLSWSTAPDDLRVIVIAGNEPYDQGPESFRESCAAAVAKGVVINTVFCGDQTEGIKTHWKDGATCSLGKYMNIDTDDRVEHISTPYDTTVLRLNDQLNATYLGFGQHGVSKKERQMLQDSNAKLYGSANVVQRANAKAKASYSNADWDLVDAADADPEVLAKLDKDQLPAELRGKSEEEIRVAVAELKTKRMDIQQQLRQLEIVIDDYIREEKKKTALGTQTLDNVLIEAVVQQALAKGFSFPK
ncbi:MAG: hypothetical protein IT260_15815 [Saprospiraceae bacterium]|nr:hypothetical protein [Saprospiraceae bacterium]